ncbi:MAG: carbohydrate binding family 9 domain-containing protein [Armatimonadota bacterium]
MHPMTRSPCFALLLAVIVLSSVSALYSAEEMVAQAQTGPPLIAAVTVEAPPVLDGILDDPCWQRAPDATGFWRREVDAPEREPTEAWICFDSSALYVAFRCHDSRPSEIRADQKKRQGSMHHDDNVTLTLDVEDAGRNSYRFRVNPAGTQYDQVPGGTSEKIEWKGDWRAAARTDEAGWTAEMEIPFSILRYPDGQRCFRISLERDIARLQDNAVWPPGYARRQDPEECARLAGIAAPPVPFRYVIMPYALSVVSEQKADREALTAGIDLKGTFANGVVALATYNPDFRNIEDVVETINFTFVERYLPEYRPFFQEGSGYGPYTGDEWYQAPVSLFYSRRIGELDWGAKSFGTVGSHRFGILDAYRRGGENHSVWNYEQLFGTEGSLAFSGVARRVPGEPDNLAYSLGSHWTFPFVGGSRSFAADWYRSSTEGEGGDDGAVILRADSWRDQGLGWSASYSAVRPEFRADDGYVPETGIRQLSLGLNHQRSYDTGPLQHMEYYANFDSGESQLGHRQGFSLDHGRSWRSGWGLWAAIGRGERDGFDVVTNSLSLNWNHQDIYRQGGIGCTWGERYGETYRYQSLSQGFRPGKNWSAALSLERSFNPELDESGSVTPPVLSRQLVLTTNYDLSEERTVSARLVRRASSTNFYAAYRQRVRKGMDLLVVAGDPNAEQWVSRLAVKAIWCL